MPGGIFWTKRVLPSAVHLLISLCQLCGFDILSPLLAFVIFNWHGHPEIKSSIFLKRKCAHKSFAEPFFQAAQKRRNVLSFFQPGNLIIFSLELGPNHTCRGGTKNETKRKFLSSEERSRHCFRANSLNFMA